LIYITISANCPAGEYWDDTKCALCPKGTYQPERYQLACLACENGLTTQGRGTIYRTQCI